MLSSHSGRDLLLGALETVVQNAFEGKRLWAENKGGITGFGYLLESTLSDTSLTDFSRSSSQKMHIFTSQDRHPDLKEKRYLDKTLSGSG